MWLQTGALDALSKTALLSLAVEALHPMLDLIDGLLLPVETLDANQVEHVTDQVALNRHIEG